MLLLLYSPAVVLLPIVLLALVFFVVIPGGFVIVLGAVSWVLSLFIGMVRLAAVSLLDSVSTNRRRATVRRRRGGSTTQSPAGRRTARALPPLTASAMTVAPPDGAHAHNPSA
jgi:membrane protein implicated in regulation of membrane protease activity